MPFCIYCGNRIPDDANFCPSCGRQVSSVQRSTAVYNPQKEIREAVHAGERALDSLYAAQAELNKAMSWGFVDMLGGGALTSFIKKSKMSNAQACIEQAKRDLKAFQSELSDVSGLEALNIDKGDFLSFADWFFDGFAVDFFVQSRIANAKKSVDKAILMVEQILSQLRLSLNE